MKNNKMRTSIASVLILSMSTWGLPALAAPISAQQVMTQTVTEHNAAQRAELVTWLDREDVRQQMTNLGVSPTQALARVASLTDAEVSRLAGEIETSPAAGNGVVGAIVFVFLVLVVTDLLGLTKVFPFTRSAR
ncbi:MAG: PA2779 family protein [Moraxellaceae bacterium]|nr:PA2779 family protein [Moraxellaceae bacterium]MDP1775299.1 PA2779 family protein [Moraxellaceae bacterium]MDZ4297058.1 PA2779 family protein [Moraxellaceae bacterium]MDZ4386912.1 PA2779 family protein [Moraxellaceae bacterium]